MNIEDISIGDILKVVSLSNSEPLDDKRFIGKCVEVIGLDKEDVFGLKVEAKFIDNEISSFSWWFNPLDLILYEYKYKTTNFESNECALNYSLICIESINKLEKRLLRKNDELKTAIEYNDTESINTLKDAINTLKDKIYGRRKDLKEQLNFVYNSYKL